MVLMIKFIHQISGTIRAKPLVKILPDFSDRYIYIAPQTPEGYKLGESQPIPKLFAPTRSGVIFDYFKSPRCNRSRLSVLPLNSLNLRRLLDIFWKL